MFRARHRLTLPGALIAALLIAALMIAPTSAHAKNGAAGFNLINNSGQSISNLFIRRTGTQSWQPLPATPAKPAKGSQAASPFADPDCAFDIKATLADSSEAVWAGVNLCEVKSLTLNRNATGATWADYD